MIKLVTMSFPEFLNKKLIEWKFKEGKRKTLDNFAALLGIKRSLLSDLCHRRIQRNDRIIDDDLEIGIRGGMRHRKLDDLRRGGIFRGRGMIL